MHADAVEIGDITVYREVDQPGWRWSTLKGFFIRFVFREGL